MRILFLINFYLIHGSGGEDLSCQQVIAGLKQRGHTTLVLTSMQGTNNLPVEEDGISRSLYLEMDLVPFRHSLTFFTHRKPREKHNLQCLERVVEKFQPDIIFIWGMWNLPRSLAAFAEARYPDKVVYRFATYWPTLPSQHDFYWRTHGRKWYSQLPKHVLGHIALAMLAKEAQQPPLTYKHSMCVSAATRNILVEAGIPVSNARIIHTGLDVALYLNGKQQQAGHDNQSLRLLYAGRLAPDKDIDTAIRAVAKLVAGQDLRSISLSLAGSGSAVYESQLRNLVHQEGLTDYVSFLGWVPHEEMPRLLHKFDILLVTSTWAEPFARVVLEGMISGLVVVATPTGGTSEIISDGENGLLFTPGDPEDLAQKIMCLVVDRELRQKLALAGQKTIKEKFTMTKMMDEIEGYLQEVAQGTTQKQGNPSKRREVGNYQQNLPTVSVVIPTYNRIAMLRDTLNSLARQTYPRDYYEVIVVDDGSTDGTDEITKEEYPFTLRYFWQSNQGDAAARNLGAQQSKADILVFLDDDIVVDSSYLIFLMHAHDKRRNKIVVGTWDFWPADVTPLSRAIYPSSNMDHSISITKLPFRDVYSNNMSIWREDFFKIGMMKGLDFSGSSMWCDLDFSYRAYRQGFDFFRSNKAICWHRDYAVRFLSDYKKRMKTASKRAVVLFQLYPELISQLPMFYDKTPIDWRKDPSSLIIRKLSRSMTSSRLALWSMEQIVNVLEKSNPESTVLPPLYRRIIGGYIFHGYREGLRDFGRVFPQTGSSPGTSELI